MLVCHAGEPRQTLKLVASNKVVGLLASKVLKDFLCFAVKIKILIQIGMLGHRQYQF